MQTASSWPIEDQIEWARAFRDDAGQSEPEKRVNHKLRAEQLRLYIIFQESARDPERLLDRKGRSRFDAEWRAHAVRPPPTPTSPSHARPGD